MPCRVVVEVDGLRWLWRWWKRLSKSHVLAKKIDVVWLERKQLWESLLYAQFYSMLIAAVDSSKLMNGGG